MQHFRLKVFHTVARHLSFTRAANELFITQPAITKHIKELESNFGLRLFDRRGNKVELTKAGEILESHAERIFAIYQELEFELSSLKEELTGMLRIGACTTFGHYILPAILSLFREKYQSTDIELHTGNTRQVESWLSRGDIDLGIVDGEIHKRDLKYDFFIEDQLILVTNPNNPTIKEKSIAIKDLLRLPLLVRERGSGTLEVIEGFLKRNGVRLNDIKLRMQIGSNESIKQYLQHSDSVAFLSKRVVKNELQTGRLVQASLLGSEFKRSVYFAQPTGGNHGFSDTFVKFARHYFSDNEGI